MELGYQIAATMPAGLPARPEVANWILATLVSCGYRIPGSVTVRVVDASEMRALNQQYRGRPGATDVLAFPFERIAGIKEDHLGDLVICADVAAEQAREQNKTFIARFAHLVIHGTLHLCGHDHKSDREAMLMEQLECVTLSRLGYANPYEYPTPDPSNPADSCCD